MTKAATASQDETAPTVSTAPDPVAPTVSPPTLLIIGGGWTGIELARLNPGCVLIEKQELWAKRLAQELPACRVVAGEACKREVLEEAQANNALYLALLTGSDQRNVKVALKVKQFFPKLKLFGRLYDPKEAQTLKNLGVQTCTANDNTLPQSLNDLLHSHTKSLAEVFLVEGHPWINCLLGSLKLPEGCQPSALQRGDEMLAPSDDLLLQTNDQLLVLCSRAPGPLIAQALSSPAAVRPFQRFLVMLNDGTALVGRFKEALLLAQTSGAQLLLAGPEDMDELMAAALAEARKLNVVAERVIWERGRLTSMLRAGKADEVGSQGLATHQTDCVILPLDGKRSLGDWLLGRWPLADVLLEKGHPPILIARTYAPYRKVLLTLDGRPDTQQAASYGLRMARLFDSQVHLLIYHGYDLDVTEHHREVIQRAAQAYHLPLTEEVVNTHLGLEFIHHLKSEDYDLAVISARTRTLRKETLKTAMHLAPGSLLVIP